MVENILRLIFVNGLPCCLLALGIFITFKLLDFADMTAEGSFLIGAAVTALGIKLGMFPLLATLLGMLGGAVCGFITGILNRVLKIPKLLSGIITMTATASIALVLFGVANGSSFAAEVNFSGCSTIYSVIPNALKGWNIIIVMAVVVLICYMIIYFFFGTEYGMAIRATGINEKMAISQGINTDWATIIAVCISNALIGLAGSLFAQKGCYVSATSATGFLVVGLAAILIGEAIFGRRSFKLSLISVVVGSLIYYVIISLTTFVFNMPTELNPLLYAGLITLALCLPMIKSGCKKLYKKVRKGGVQNA